MKINHIIHTYSLIFILLFTTKSSVMAENVVAQVTSPDEEITLKLIQDDNLLFYQISKGSENLISKSRLGIHTTLADFSSGLTFKTVTSNKVNDTYSLPSGKKSTYINNYNEVVATFEKSGEEIQIVCRVYNDGVAYQYVIDGTGEITINSETSQCDVTYLDKLYSQVYSKNYKNIVEEAEWEVTSCLNHTSLPVLIKTKNDYVLLSEAMVNGQYAASQLIIDEESQALEYSFIGAVNSTLPFQSPWRTIFIGSLNTIVESTLLDNLNPETEISDLSWIKPGRTAWNYGGEDTSDYLSITNIRKYIDWAQEMGWEYFTLDRGWQNHAQLLQQVVSYGNTKGIGIFIWVNQNMLSSSRNALNNTLFSWKTQGVKGLKVDFWEDDSQEMMKKYDLLLELAAEHKLLLNFHSCTKPTGLRRTWPHLLTSEAVFTNAHYMTSPAVVSPTHNINSAIMRTALGPTDYCPVDFANKNGKILHGTTWAHQLALSVVFESGLQHIMEAPENIEYHIANDFLKNVPAAWDDTRCLEADFGNHITMARKKADDWYVASLTHEARTFTSSLSFLSPGQTYHAYIYKDSECASEIEFEYKDNLKSGDNITIELARDGGFAMILSPISTYAKPIHTKYEAESAENLIPFGIAIKEDPDGLCSNGKFLSSIGRGRAVTFRKINVPQSGTYAITFYYMAASPGYAYVKVNDAVETSQEHYFPGTGNTNGRGLGHKTIIVELDASVENSIEFGNYTDYAPDLDRIVISPTDKTISNLEDIETEAQTNNIYVMDNTIRIEQEGVGEYRIYNTVGQIVATDSFNGGGTSVSITTNGVYVVEVRTADQSYSKKIIIK